MTSKEKKDIKVEIKARKLVIKKLDSAIKALEKPVTRIVLDRVKRKDQLSEYKDENDLQDAYGWGFITEEEYNRLLDAMRDGTAAIDSEVAAEEIAVDMLTGWRRIMSSDIASLEFELLPKEEQARIQEENYRIAMEREERRRNREHDD